MLTGLRNGAEHGRGARAAAARARASPSATTRSAARSPPARRSSRGPASPARPTRSATGRVELTVPLHARRAAAALQPYDPANPPSDVANTTTDQGKTVPFIVRQERGDARPRRVPHRRALPARQAVAAVGASAGLQQQARHLPRVQLRHRVRAGGRARRAERDGARARLRHDVARAQQRRPQLQHRHPGRVDDHDQGARGRALRRRSGTRSAAAARAARSPSSRWPTPTPASTRASRPPCSFTDAWSSAMHYVDYAAAAPLLREPRRSGRPASPGRPSEIAAVEGHPNPLNAVTFTTAIPFERRAQPQLPGRPRGAGLRRATPTRNGVRCTLQDYMVNIFGRRASDGFAQRPFDNVGIEYGRKALDDRGDHARPVRRPQRQGSAAGTSTTTLGPARGRGRPPGARAASTAAARSTRATTSTRWRSSTCAAPTPARSTTSTGPTRCARA